MSFARAVLLAALVAGCSGGGNDDAMPVLRDGHTRLVSEHGVGIDVRTTEPLRTGANGFAVQVETPGAQLVSATGLMPSHGHGTRPATIAPTADGWVVSDLVLYMSGRWQVRLVLSGDDEGTFLVDVP